MINLLHHCTLQLFLTVVTVGSLIVIITALTMDNNG